MALTNPQEHRKLNMPVVVVMITGKVVGGGLLLVPIALSNMGEFDTATADTRLVLIQYVTLPYS